jgi:hypothetical protein
MTNGYPTTTPTQPGALEKYFDSSAGSEFIEAVKSHLEKNPLDFPGAIVAGINNAVQNNSITSFGIALAIDGVPLVLAIIRYFDSVNKRNKQN